MYDNDQIAKSNAAGYNLAGAGALPAVGHGSLNAGSTLNQMNRELTPVEATQQALERFKHMLSGIMESQQMFLERMLGSVPPVPSVGEKAGRDRNTGRMALIEEELTLITQQIVAVGHYQASIGRIG